MIDFKLQATEFPTSIKQYQLALDAAFNVGKAIAGEASKVLINQLVNDKVELQAKLDAAIAKLATLEAQEPIAEVVEDNYFDGVLRMIRPLSDYGVGTKLFASAGAVSKEIK